MDMKLKRNLKGYTLIEILVVISIVMIVFSLGVAGFRDFSRRQSISKMAKQMTADLRSMQQYASIGQKPTGYTCHVLDGYSFYRVSSTNYLIRANCTNTPGGAVAHTVKDVTLSDNITFTSTNQTILFKVIGQGTNLTVDNQIRLTHQSGQTVDLIIGVGGDIK